MSKISLLTTGEVAGVLRCHRATVYQYMNKAGLPYTEVGGRRRIREDKLAEWLAERDRSHREAVPVSPNRRVLRRGQRGSTA